MSNDARYIQTVIISGYNLSLDHNLYKKSVHKIYSCYPDIHFYTASDKYIEMCAFDSDRTCSTCSLVMFHNLLTFGPFLAYTVN